jgi:hypothetical protein
MRNLSPSASTLTFASWPIRTFTNVGFPSTRTSAVITEKIRNRHEDSSGWFWIPTMAISPSFTGGT